MLETLKPYVVSAAKLTVAFIGYVRPTGKRELVMVVTAAVLGGALDGTVASLLSSLF